MSKEEEPVKWPEKFSVNEFIKFIQDNENLIEDDFFITEIEQRNLEDDICDCDECEEYDEGDYEAYPQSDTLTINQKSALNYFVENIKILSEERLENLVQLIKSK